MRWLVLVPIIPQAACGDCWDSPVRQADVRITLDGSTSATGPTAVRVRAGQGSGCDSPFGEHEDPPDYTFTPDRDAQVRFGPADGELVPLVADTEPGVYVTELVAPFSPVYRFTVGPETIDLDAPRYFTATAEGVPPTLTLVETLGPNDLGGERGTSVIVYAPDGTRGPGESFFGTSATLAARHFDNGPGIYRIELGRSALTLPPDLDGAMSGGTIELVRTLEVQVN